MQWPGWSWGHISFILISPYSTENWHVPWWHVTHHSIYMGLFFCPECLISAWFHAPFLRFPGHGVLVQIPADLTPSLFYCKDVLGIRTVRLDSSTGGDMKKWPQRQGLHLANLFKILSRGFSKRTWFAGLNDEAINTQHIKLSTLFVLAVISSVMMAGTDLMKQPKYLCTQRKRGRTGQGRQARLANVTHISPRTQLFLMLFSWTVQVFLKKKKKRKKNLYEILAPFLVSLKNLSEKPFFILKTFSNLS